MLLGLFLWVNWVSGPAAAQSPANQLGELERTWLELRTLQDQLGITRNLGDSVSPQGVPADSLAARASRLMARVRALANEIPAERLDREDSRALGFLREQLATLEAQAAERPAPATDVYDCSDPLPPRMWQATLAALTARTFECYGAAARLIVVDGDTLDRLSILGLLGRTEARERRRLFLSLEPVWRSVNGDDGEASPYRRMVAGRVAGWAGTDSPFEARARGLGVAPDTLERWLVAILEAWRRAMPDTVLEPWDFYYLAGEASRLLSGGIPRDSLRPIADRYYRELGADPGGLGVRYDLDPRPGKYPISFTDFGGRDPIEPWIFTSYRTGGLDNLAELLHEVGHAVHIAAIDRRGAYRDWPDSDTFTEAIADLAALEIYEPDWQRRYLGRAAPLASSIRAKYSGIVLDVAWALFEIRVHRDPALSPNSVWTAITRDYLRIRPHPEWSWWAIRGQLVGSPGYMLNYAFGAILIADVRDQVRARRGSFAASDPGWYDWVGKQLLRFGRERPARVVVEEFLGRPLAVGPLLRDIERVR